MTELMSKSERTRRARRVTIIGLIWNVLLTVFKFLVGIYAKSNALVADAVHSLSDLASDIGLIIGLNVADKPFDLNHNYGHGKYETLATIFIGITLFFVGLGILWNSIHTIYLFLHGQTIPRPGSIALVAIFISVILKEWMYHYTVRSGKFLHSQALIANAWHHRSDAFSSIAVLIGVSGAILLGEHWVVLDPISAAVVSIFILKVSVKASLSSLNELMEVSLSEERRKEIIKLVSEVEGVNVPHNLKTRQIGNTIAIDMHIKVNKNLSIIAAHDISTRVEEKIRESFGRDTFISVHVEPLLDQTAT